jgi:hypothetical protein
MLKQQQLCNIQTATRLAVQRDQMSLGLYQGHKYLKGNQRERKTRVVGRKLFLVRLGVADCFSVVVVLP